MAKLPEQVKVFIVEQLAEFKSPQTVADAVKERWGITIQRGHVAGYSPKYKPPPSEKWVALYTAHREQHLKNEAEIGCAHRAVRLATLDRAIGAAEHMKNYALVATLLEQAAKEMGESYSNRKKVELTGKDGEPLKGVTVEIHNEDGAEPIVEEIG